MHALAVEREQLLHGSDAFAVEARFGAGSNSGKIRSPRCAIACGSCEGREPDEAIRLLHVAGDLGEIAIWRYADGAAERFANVSVDGLLDVECDAACAWRFLFAANELADHLVNRRIVGDGADRLYGVGDCFGIFCVLGVIALDEDDLGAALFCFAYLRAGLDAEGLRLIARGNAAGGVSHGGDDCEGTVAVFGMELLLDGGEEAVEVDIGESRTGQVGKRWTCDVRLLYSPFICLRRILFQLPLAKNRDLLLNHDDEPSIRSGLSSMYEYRMLCLVKLLPVPVMMIDGVSFIAT